MDKLLQVKFHLHYICICRKLSIKQCNDNYSLFHLFSALTDFEEPAIVKQFSAHSLYNLLTIWDDIESSTQIGKSMQLPLWPVLDDLTKLLSHVYWLPTLSEVFGNKPLLEDSFTMDEGMLV